MGAGRVPGPGTRKPGKKFQNPEPGPENFQTRNPGFRAGSRNPARPGIFRKFFGIFFKMNYFFLFIIAFQYYAKIIIYKMMSYKMAYYKKVSSTHILKRCSQPSFSHTAFRKFLRNAASNSYFKLLF